MSFKETDTCQGVRAHAGCRFEKIVAKSDFVNVAYNIFLDALVTNLRRSNGVLSKKDRQTVLGQFAIA